jgi:hypothetical protein
MRPQAVTITGVRALLQEIGTVFELAFEPHKLDALDGTTVVMRMDVADHAATT